MSAGIALLVLIVAGLILFPLWRSGRLRSLISNWRLSGETSAQRLTRVRRETMRENRRIEELKQELVAKQRLLRAKAASADLRRAIEQADKGQTLWFNPSALDEAGDREEPKE